ncbi:MAG TPA: beta-galactosidase, partial [Tepidisphaeraceae bacterium]|jgi:beta-galactosidase
MSTSYAPSDTVAFRAWLKAKYKSLDDLNAAWGTRFWSQVYSEWDQIDLPHPTATYHNPTQLLDESRFISDTVVAYCRRQATILRGAASHWQITHNGVFENVDGVKLTEQLDFFSHDQYPLFWNHWTDFAKNLLQARSLSFPYAVLEQQAGPGGQMSYLHRTPRPGEMRLWAMQSVAHGARMLSYFCWRTLPFGSEQHWHGLIDYDNKDTRRLTEAAKFGDEFRGLPADFHAARPQRCVAVLRDYDNETNDRRINTYVKNAGWDAGHWMGACFRAHVPVDQVWPAGDWAGYDVVVAPHLKIVDQSLAQKYQQFVEAGGTLVLMAQSGTKNRNLHMVQQTAPGLLRRLAGIEVADWTTVPPGASFTARFADGGALVLGGFVERLKPRGAETLAAWDDSDLLLADAPAVTRHEVGRGQVLYVGGHGNDAAAATLVAWLIANAGVTRSLEIDGEVEVIDRRSEKHRYLVLLNHSSEAQFLSNLPAGRDLIADRRVEDGKLKLAAYDIAVIQTRLPTD